MKFSATFAWKFNDTSDVTTAQCNICLVLPIGKSDGLMLCAVNAESTNGELRRNCAVNYYCVEKRRAFQLTTMQKPFRSADG